MKLLTTTFNFCFIILLFSTGLSNAQELIPYRKGSLWGFSNEKAEIVIQPTYEYVDFFNEDLAVVGKDYKFGFINKQGKVVIPVKYEVASDFKKGVAAVMLEGKYGLVGKNGKSLTKFIYEQYAFSTNYVKLKTEKGWGLYSISKKKIIIQPEHAQIGLFNSTIDLAWFKENGKIGIISLSDGKQVLSPQLDKTLRFQSGFAVVKSEELFGVINSEGKVVIPAEYSYIPSSYSFSSPLEKNNTWVYHSKEGKIIASGFSTALPFYNGLAKVSKNGKFGFINQEGKEVIPIEYEAVGKPEEGFVAVKKDNKWGFVDFNNQIKHEFVFDDFDEAQYKIYFTEGLCLVNKNGKFGFIDTLFKQTILPQFNMATAFYNDFSLVKKGSSYGIINIRGEEVLPIKYSKIHYYGLSKYFVNGIAVASKGDKWGFINNKGVELTKFIYDSPEPTDNLEEDINILPYEFVEGICRVSVNGKIGFINSRGQEITPYQFKEATDFKNGLAAVKVKDRWGFINRKGELVTSYKYSNIYMTEHSAKGKTNHFNLVESKNYWGILGSKGKELLPCKYDDPISWDKTFRNGLMWVLFRGKDGYVSSKGIEYFEN